MDVIVYYLPIVSILSFLVVFFVVSRDDQPAFKITWVIVIMLSRSSAFPSISFSGTNAVASGWPGRSRVPAAL